MEKITINSIITKSVLGTITPDEQQILDTWLIEDDAHRKMYESLMSETIAAQRLRLLDAVDDEEAWKKFKRTHFTRNNTRYLWSMVAVAACILLLVIVGLKYFDYGTEKRMVLTMTERNIIKQSVRSGKAAATIYYGTNQVMRVNPEQQELMADGEPMPEEFFAQDAIVKTEMGKEFWMTLEDGTRVHLNYNTSLKYPSHFESDNRTVQLDGEAYFDVAHQSGRPFYVRTANGVVKDYGTSFNVNTLAAPGVTEVILVSGKVSAITNGGMEYPMKVGQLASIKANENSVVIDDVDIQPYVSWNTGVYVFDACPMDKLMKVISAWYGKRVIFDNPKTRKIEFSGSIDRYKDIEATLIAIQFVIGHEIRDDNNTIIIK